MEKLWAGRFKSALDGAADDFNASIRVDARMYREDIEGSQAHVRMLGACGIVTEAEAERILRALGEIRAELDDGRLEIWSLKNSSLARIALLRKPISGVFAAS